MACYAGEEEAWKCPKHPSKRRRNGICPTCLRDRLNNLCPDCHRARPCACGGAASTASSSSSSSGRLASLIDSEPSFRRSRSVAIPFFRFRNAEQATPRNGRTKTPSFLSVLMRSKAKKNEQTEKENEGINGDNGGENFESYNRIEDFARIVTRSRSVSSGTAAVMASGFRRGDGDSTPAAKGKFWHFPSPMKAFRSKTPKVVGQDRSPLHRG